MKAHIAARLRGTAPETDPVAAALATLPKDAVEAWFRRPPVPAAVLIPLVERAGGLNVVFTRRAEHLPDHPGQISFPGGRAEAGDNGPADTALREAHEEIRLPPSRVTVLGFLPSQPVVTGFAITPVVGSAPADVRVQADDFEVAEVFEVPLEYLLDEASCVRTIRRYAGVEVPAVEYRYRHWRIWGATAGILDSFINIIKTVG